MSTPTEGSTWTYFTWRGCSKCGETDGVTFRVRPGAIPESKCACGHEDVTKPHKFAPSEASTPTEVPEGWRNIHGVEELIRKWQAVSGGQASMAGTLAEWLGQRCVCVDLVTNDAVRDAFNKEKVWDEDGLGEGSQDEQMRRAFARLTL